MWLRLWAKLTGGRVVLLMDHDGEITRSIARDVGFGKLHARRMIGSMVVLDKNGRVIRPIYCKFWEYER